MTEFLGLGRRPSFDVRNLNHLITDVLPYDETLQKVGIAMSRAGGLADLSTNAQTLKVKPVASAIGQGTSKYYYDSQWHGDQGSTSACTGFSGAHLLSDGPIVQGKKGIPAVDPFLLYSTNQQNDRKMGYNWAEGASSLALGQTLTQLGFASEYLWGYDLDSFLQAIRKGPVLFGTNWLTGMDSPDKKHGIIRAIGRNRGGHEILINGVNLNDGMVRLKNSWGLSWGKNGHAYLPFEDLEVLLAQDGDLLFITETKPTTKP